MVRQSSWFFSNLSPQTPFVSGLLFLSLLTGAIASPIQNRKSETGPPGEVPAEIADSLGGLLTLEAKGDRLNPVICTSFQDARAAFESMGQRMGGSSSGGGENQWQHSRDCDPWAIAGRYGLSGRTFRRTELHPEFVLEFVDKTRQGCRLSVIANEDGYVRLFAINKASPDCFCLIQQPDGKLFTAGVADGQVHSGAAANYRQLAAERTLIVYDFLVPELRKWGLTKISGRFSSEVRELLFQFLATPDADAQAEFDATVAELSASVFETRENASKWLLKNASSHKGLMLKAFLGSSLPPEPRTRIRSALERGLKKSEFETLCQIESQKLADDPELLIWLLGETADADLQANIYRQLKQVTRQGLANDIAAWKEWLAQSGKRTAEVGNGPGSLPPPESYAKLQGPLVDLAPIVNLILPLAVIDGKIQMDRARWTNRYHGKSVEQLGNDLRQFAIERELPLDWINVEVDALKEIDYPHLIFQQFEAKAKTEANADMREMMGMHRSMMMREMAPNRNPHVETEDFAAALELDEGSNILGGMYSRSRPKGESIFVFTLVDEKNPANSLRLGKWPGDDLRILITGENTLVQVYQFASGKCALDCAVESTAFHGEFASADELLAEPHFAELVAPYLKQFGIEIQPAATPSTD